MTLSAVALLARLEPGTPLDVRDEDDNCVLTKCPYDHIKFLAQAGVITAKTRAGKPRYAVLHCTITEADQIVIQGAKEARPARAGSITSGASRTVVHQTIHGHKRTFRHWKFIRGDAFAFSSSRLHTVASKIEAAAS